MAPPTIPPPPEGTVDNEMAKLVGEFNRLVDFIVNYGFGGPGADREWAELVRKEMRVAHYLVGLCIELGPSGGVHRRMLADEMRVVRWKMKKANDEEQAALLAAAGAEATARGYPEGARPRGK